MKSKIIRWVITVFFVLAIVLGFVGPMESKTLAANNTYDSGNIVGSTTAPYFDDVIGISRTKLINELLKNKSRYHATKFSRQVSPFFTRENTMSLGGRFNCTGFVMTALERSGADLGRIRPNPGADKVITSLDRTSRFIVYNKKARSYRYTSVSALLNSGRAQKGDIIIMQPKDWSVGYKDNHVGIFWGNNPSDNKFWHSTSVWGNAITNIKGFVTNPVYYLVKLNPGTSGNLTINSKSNYGDKLASMKFNLLDSSKRPVNVSVVSNNRYIYNPSSSRITMYTDSSGVAKISDLPVGTYYIRQTEEVFRHYKMTYDKKVYISASNIYSSIVNNKIVGSATIYSKDNYDNMIRPMNMQILDADKNVVNFDLTSDYRYRYNPRGNRTSVWVDQDGFTKITNLPIGQYYIRQLNTIPYHEKRTTDRPLYIVENYDKVAAMINNKTVGSATIYSKDNYDNMIRPMNMQILDANKNVVKLDVPGDYRYRYNPKGSRTSVWVDQDGITKITNLPIGQYYIRQLNTIPYHEKRTTDRPLYIVKDYDKIATMYNYKKTGTTTIYAKDDLGSPLWPINLQVLDKDMNVVKLDVPGDYRYRYNPNGSRTSIWVDKDGIAKISNLPIGQYYLRQVNEISNYEKRTTDRPLWIEYNSDKEATIINPLTSGSTSIKLVDVGGNPIWPGNFEILDSNMNIVNMNVTDNYRYSYNPNGNRISVWVDRDGITQIKNLPAGQYYIRQISTANSYVKSETESPLTVVKGGDSEIIITNDKLVSPVEPEVIPNPVEATPEPVEPTPNPVEEPLEPIETPQP